MMGSGKAMGATIGKTCSVAVRIVSMAMLSAMTIAGPIDISMSDHSFLTTMSTTNRAGNKYDCLSDNECDIGKYCDFHDGDLLEFGECIPLVKENEKCTSSYGRDTWVWLDGSTGPDEHHNCAKGLYCDDTERCRRMSDVGEKCDPDIYHSCRPGTFCDEKKQRCRKQGRKGKSCDPSDYRHNPCDERKGLFCNRTKVGFNKGICEPKVAEGSASRQAGCLGFEIQPDSDRNPICILSRNEGQVCTHNAQCRGERRSGSTRKDTVCNWIDKKTGRLPRYGVCAKEKDLLKKVGLACTPERDLCDARRDLRCEGRKSKDGSQHVCVQSGGIIPRGKTHCTPDSKYSKCPGQTCRQFTKMISQKPYGPYLCLREVEKLKEGQICSLFEHAHCDEGMECVKALDVSRMDSSAKPIGHCVRRAEEGEKCKRNECMPDPCEGDLVCDNGRCARGKVMANSVVCPGYGMSCKKQKPRCAPGLACIRGRCLLPEETVDVGEACGETSARKKVCTRDAICEDWDGNRGGKCEKYDIDKRIAGASCWDDWGACKKGLDCSDWLDVGVLLTSQKVCYKKKESLEVGQKCEQEEVDDDDRDRSPHAGKPVPKCYVPDKGQRPLKCIDSVCQEEARLFDSCDPKKHIVCEQGLACISKTYACLDSDCIPEISVCLGSDEVH